MAYLSNNARLASFTLGGVDYSSSLISWTVSDTSANKNGCIETTGTAVIGTQIGTSGLEDYDRNRLRRGTEAVLSVTTPSGSTVVHPRGRLYVISNTYNAEEETLQIELGCRLTLLSINESSQSDQLTALRALVPMTLDPAQSAYSNCCAGLASVGSYVFQNNLGNLEVNDFWAGDNYQQTASGEWTSVLGVTTNSVSPLTGSGAIPDEIKLSYSVPSDEIASDQAGRVDTVETESYYFLQYPVVNYERQARGATADQPNGTLNQVTATATESRNNASSSSSCGNNPTPPDDSESDSSCNENYTTVQSPVYVPAYRLNREVTTYAGPAAQVSMVLREDYGPLFEANQQYFADKYAFCRQRFAANCKPNGGCPYSGLSQTKLGYSVQRNIYGSANELVRTITDTYRTRLSAAQPSDWRAGNVSGKITDFDNNFDNNTGFYRLSRVEVEYSRSENANIQTTTTYTSATSRGTGINANRNIDALRGIKTKQIRTSTTISALDLQPDALNSPTTSTVEKEESIVVFSGRYTSTPLEAGPNILEEQIPQPLLFENQQDIDDTVAAYSQYLLRFVKGDAFGLQIGEGLREDIMTNWRPGMPLRYYDPSKDVLLAMRMDACSWGVSQSEAAVITDALWNGVSNGSVQIPSNVLGNSSPDMNATIDGTHGYGAGGGAGVPTPPPPPTSGTVTNETVVDSGSFTFSVDVHFMFQAIAVTYSVDGIQPPTLADPIDANIDHTTTCFVEGFIVGTGDLLATNSDGSIPVDYNGSIVTVGATVVDPDLFSSS